MTSRRTAFLSIIVSLTGLLHGIPAKAQDMATGRQSVLLVSIDGLRPDVVLNADLHGMKIPTLRSLMAQGAYAQEVINVNPTVTNPNHTTLVTGVLPAEHGVLNNRSFEASEKGGASYSSYSQIKAQTLWGAAKAAGLTTGSAFWPVTGGSKDIDVDIRNGASDDDARIADEVIALIAARSPDLLTVHFVSLDHEAHEHGPDSAEARTALERIDAALGRVIAAERQADPQAIVAVASDHGFAPLSQQINLNVAFVEADLVTLGGDSAVTSWSAFAWYVGSSAMIVLKDPNDGGTRERVATLLGKLAADPANGIEGVHDRAAMSGLGLAPETEFMVGFKSGYKMGMPLTGPLRTTIGGGGHGAFSTTNLRPDMHSAFFISGPGVAAGKNLGVVDMRRIAPTLADRLKISLPAAVLPAIRLWP